MTLYRASGGLHLNKLLPQWDLVSNGGDSIRQSVDSAIWLIAGGHTGQALVVLHNAIEIALKAELEGIHRVLIADDRELRSFDRLKRLLREAYSQHPKGASLQIEESDLERTITFGEAFERVKDIHAELNPWTDNIVGVKSKRTKSLHDLRNQIVHYGGRAEDEGSYVSSILQDALPFLAKLLRCMSRGEAVASITAPPLGWLGREIEVGQQVLKLLANNNRPPASYAIRPLAHHALWAGTLWPTPYDDIDVVTNDKEQWSKYVERQCRTLLSEWDVHDDDDQLRRIDCPICGSRPEGSLWDIPAFILLRESLNEGGLDNPATYRCLICDFSINSDEAYLAEAFLQGLPLKRNHKFLVGGSDYLEE